MFSAEIIADSKNEFGQRMTTFVIEFPRMILAEFNTHRMLSRNSASSRAIPFEKMVKRVEENPFIPLKWMKDHKGMQGNEYFEGDIDTDHLKEVWIEARDAAISNAKFLSEEGLTKQVCNRLLEPFMWHTVIVTASEWQNFFALRAHEAAEIHMQKIAYMMLEEYNKSTPKELKAGEWHIPFGDKMDEDRLFSFQTHIFGKEEYHIPSIEELKVKIATARCARVSYLNFEGKDDYEADIKLHNMLSKMGHWSPFEHCARAMSEWETENWHSMGVNLYENGASKGSKYIQEGWCGNFRGFVQYRKMFGEENKFDLRVTQK